MPCPSRLTARACWLGLALAMPTALAATPSQRVDALFAEYASAEGPGCSVGVAREGELVHGAGYGMANLEYGIPLDADSVFRTGSVSKQFTAAAVALAAEEGLIDLDAGIGTYLPELHESVQGATVRQVVGHTGGLPDYESNELNAVLKDAMGNEFNFGNEDHLSTEEFYEVTQAVEQTYVPGTQYQYSNIGYFWLGQIVERVTGERLRAYGQRRIFEPAGMTHSLFNDDVNRIVPQRASGYRPLPDGGFEIFETNLDWVGEGGVYTSVNDMALWNQQYRQPTLGEHPEALREQLVTPVSDIVNEASDGATSSYAFGLSAGVDANGRDFVAHGGSWVAFRAYYKRLPREDFAYWVLCNRPDARPASFGPTIEAIFLED